MDRFYNVIIVPGIKLSLFPGEPENDGSLDPLFFHAPDEVLCACKFGIRGAIDRPKRRVLMDELIPLFPEGGWKKVGMEINDHLTTAARDFSRVSG